MQGSLVWYRKHSWSRWDVNHSTQCVNHLENERATLLFPRLVLSSKTAHLPAVTVPEAEASGAYAGAMVWRQNLVLPSSPPTPHHPPPSGPPMYRVVHPVVPPLPLSALPARLLSLEPHSTSSGMKGPTKRRVVRFEQINTTNFFFGNSVSSFPLWMWFSGKIPSTKLV